MNRVLNSFFTHRCMFFSQSQKNLILAQQSPIVQHFLTNNLILIRFNFFKIRLNRALNIFVANFRESEKSEKSNGTRMFDVSEFYRLDALVIQRRHE